MGHMALLGAGRGAIVPEVLAAVGTFAKKADGTGTQSVTGVGFTPKALILWSAGDTADATMTAHARGLIGCSSAPGESVAIVGESFDAQAASSASRRIAAKAFTLAAGGAECDLDSFDADGFTLDWTANNAAAYRIHYLAIGGAGVTAKAMEWTLPAVAGNQAVAGVGFEPDAVLFLNGISSAAWPVNSADLSVGFGAMDAAGNEWALHARSQNAQATSNTVRVARTDRCLVNITAAKAVNFEAEFVSVGADGFTVNVPTTSNGARMGALCLGGIRAKVGVSDKDTGAATATQAITGVGFTPKAVLIAHTADADAATPQDHARFGLGASVVTSEVAIATSDTDNLADTSADSYSNAAKAVVKMNNNTQTVDAAADIASFDSDGFTLSWTTNDAVATKLLWVAVG